MADDVPAVREVEPSTTVTGGNKPLHRFLRAEPKSIGIALVIMGVSQFLFGLTVKSDVWTTAYMCCPLWLGILFTICGLLYILSERNPAKKIITASFALSILSIIGVIFAFVDLLIEHITQIDLEQYLSFNMGNYTEEENLYRKQHYMLISVMERVFLCHMLIGALLIITMTVFARAALRSSRTQAVVIMSHLSPVE